jgi:hypothetical protein
MLVFCVFLHTLNFLTYCNSIINQIREFIGEDSYPLLSVSDTVNDEYFAISMVFTNCLAGDGDEPDFDGDWRINTSDLADLTTSDSNDAFYPSNPIISTPIPEGWSTSNDTSGVDNDSDCTECVQLQSTS